MGETHPPATNDNVSGNSLYKHLKLLRECRKAFVEVESSERIQRALRHKVRENAQVFEPGCQVYHKKENTQEWQGPAKVVHQDGKVIFVRHGAFLLRVFVNRVVQVSHEYESNLVKKSVNKNADKSAESAESVDTACPDIKYDLNVPNCNSPNVNNENIQNNQNDDYELVTWKELKKNDLIQFR